MGNKQPEFLDTEYFYRDDGSIEAEWPVLDGLRHGNMRVYYKSGNLRSIVQYVHGIKHGKETGYLDNIIHKVEYKCTYVNGRKHGVETFYGPDGNLIEYNFYIHGIIRSGSKLPDGHHEFSKADKFDIWCHKLKCKIF